jgi:hypothetical protein
MKPLALLLCLLAIGCKKNTTSTGNNAGTSAPTLTITGDFNGDGTIETLIQDIADSTGTAVKYIPETPAEIENDTTNEGWYRYIEFYSNLNYRTRLHTEKLKTDALYFGNSQGLYCLINVGNLNTIKGDEIALVIDRLDQSRSNDCQIFTLCNGVWQQVFAFSVHEDAFDYKRGEVAILKNIPEALEFKDGQWKYMDYMDMPYERIEDVGKMLPLTVPGCDK